MGLAIEPDMPAPPKIHIPGSITSARDRVNYRRRNEPVAQSQARASRSLRSALTCGGAPTQVYAYCTRATLTHTTNVNSCPRSCAGCGRLAMTPRSVRDDGGPRSLLASNGVAECG